LASAGSKLATSQLGAQPASPATITNAPLATYPTTSAPPVNEIPPLNVASAQSTGGSPGAFSATSTASGLATTRQPAPLASIPAAGPYDPNGYQPSASVAASQLNGSSVAPTTADRYGNYATAPPAPSIPPVSTPLAATPANTASVDRYAMPAVSGAPMSSTPSTSTAPSTTDRYAYTPAAPSGTLTPSPVASTSDPYGSPLGAISAGPPATGYSNRTTPTAPVVNAAPATVMAAPLHSIAADAVAAPPAATADAATVQIKSPAGQYRPGGTSSYTNGAASNRVDVASRQGPPSTTIPAPVPQSTTPPSDPWTPQPHLPAAIPATRQGGNVSAGGLY
jgi:subtilase-type serine protease